MLKCILGIVLIYFSYVEGHGRLLDPPQRSSLWRFYKDIGAPRNYNDNELFCGGFARQQRNDGKCGVCGDPYDGDRENEAGGKYAIGFISRTYQEGQRINVTVQLTAPHKGYFKFKIYPHNDVHTPVSQQHLDMHPLLIVGQSEDPYEYKIESRKGYYYILLQLPDGITCSQCVLQWHYTTGNSHGCDPDGTCCVGCGPQETFINCADVSIVGNDVPLPSRSTLPATTTAPRTEKSSTTSATTIPQSSTTPTKSIILSSIASTAQVTTTTRTTVTPPKSTTTSTEHTLDCDLDYIPECIGVGIVPPSDLWCTKVCREGKNGCTPDLCQCTCVKQLYCVPVGFYDTLPGMIDWCNDHCRNGACPGSDICDCS